MKRKTPRNPVRRYQWNHYSHLYQQPSDDLNMILTEEKGPRKVVQFAFSEITCGRSIGTGGFSTVSEIVAIDLDDVNDTDEADTQQRKDLAREVNQTRAYVLKMLRTDLPVEEHIKGVTDLAIESDFLRTLSHPHIIQMRAMANTDPRESRFFIVLDRLSGTLDKKFNYWRKLVGEASGTWFPLCGYCCAKAPQLHALWKERLHVARDTAKAIEYLHANRIVYRDLKPDNLGFTDSVDPQIQLFDFGLAKRLDGIAQNENGCYLLTGNTGSLRYMAPEVALDRPYNETVDAYSFGVLFWQICSLQTPFAGYNQRMHDEKVVQQGQRPNPHKSWPYSWSSLMEACWATDIAKRPSFRDIVVHFEEIVQLLEQEDGIIPSRTSEIKAKKKRKAILDATLDTDTRLTGEKRNDAEIV
ncbi:hypothetical protein FisN_1Lh007 [Fistulifera solaris]|uniref:Protein kinase domain-containing protein n=1 Tax=Fistulifera solaris TaxID=1519565 RepID=A0A1Z5JCB5_FISSO|nr:hypothetical protein FisN_1Lh007 [Fistulifera solaris]|eukprot:GAX11625.1 hypothetical protein FisN_1Lh007 [Fistulifera solaris]